MAAIRIALLNIRLALRIRVAMFFTFIFPLIFLFAYGGIFAHGSPQGMAFLFGPVVVLQVIGSTLWGLGMQSVVQRERGSLRRFRLAPVGAGTMVGSSMLANYLLLLPTVALLVFCARVFFYMPLTISLLDLFILVTVGDFAFAGFGLTIGSVANTMQEAQVYNNIAFFPLLFLSGATIPLAALPGWLQRVAAFLPATYLVSAFQGVMSQAESLRAHGAELLALVISGIFGLLFATKLFRWEKEDRMKASNKWLALAFVVPFLLIGVWMNARGNPGTAWAAAFKMANGDNSGSAKAPNGTQAGVGPFLIKNVRLFDGTRVTSGNSIIVKSGKIASVGENLAAPAGAEVIDGTGDTLLPGLIDAHEHIFNKAALQENLVFGVTTVLDMFMDYHTAAGIKREQAEGKDLDLADLRSAGTLATAPGGHGTEYGLKIPTISSPDEAQAFVDARIAEGSDYIKIIYDDGSTYGMHIPTISKATMAALVVAAHERGKMAVAHIGSYQGARDAIDVGVDGLMHLFVDRAPDPDFGRFVAAHHAFVVPTLTVLHSLAGISNGALADDPELALFLDSNDIANLKRSFPSHPGEHTTYAAAPAAIRLLKAAGVPILAGTDAPNPGTAYGASLHQELEYLVEAGLTPTEALIAATSAPAKAFHLDDRGRIASGFRADLLLVKGDPAEDIKATRDIVDVWKLGVRADRDAYRAEIEKAKQQAATAPAGSESGLVSDFDEGSTPTARFGSGWTISTDSLMGGKSTAEMKVVDGGAEGSKGSLAITGEIVAAAPFPWAGAMFTPGAQPFVPANMSSKKAIDFWAKGDGKTYRVMVFTKSLGYIPASQNFVAGPEWKEYSFPLSAFESTDGHDMEAVLFSASMQPGKFAFQIDDVRFK